MAKLFNAQVTGIPGVEGKMGAAGGLGDKIENAFLRFVQRVILWGWEFVAELAVNIFDASMKILKPGMMRMFMPFLNYVKGLKGVTPEIRAMIDNVEKEQGEAGVIGVGAALAVVGYAVISAAMQPVGLVVTQGVNTLVKPSIPPPGTLVYNYLAGKIGINEVAANMELLGYSSSAWAMIVEAARSFPTVGENIEFYRRGLITESEFDRALMALAYAPETRAKYKELVNVIPNVNDLVRFMVREAFNDGTSRKFGYDDDYPAEIDKYLPMIGISKDWGKRYWRAHWQLPSPSQAYEMLHRGLIDEGTLSELLKTADYPSFWRDKMMNMSYNVLTRVDVRRLLQAGLIDEAKAHQTYLKMGYVEEDAALLTQFAVAGASEKEKDLTRTDIVNMYEDGLTDAGSAKSAFIKMGYDASEADSIIKIADYNIAKAQRTDNINYVKEQFLAGMIDENGAAGQLSQIGLKSNGIDRYILAWKRSLVVAQAGTTVKIPSLADVRRWYQNDYIDEAQFTAYLNQLGYRADDVAIYVREANDQKTQAGTP